jgi:hypothetical protein
MSDDEDIAALVVDNGSGMCKGALRIVEERNGLTSCRRRTHLNACPVGPASNYCCGMTGVRSPLLDQPRLLERL